MSITRSKPRPYKIVAVEQRKPFWACCLKDHRGKFYWRHGFTAFGVVRKSIRDDRKRIADDVEFLLTL